MVFNAVDSYIAHTTGPGYVVRSFVAVLWHFIDLTTKLLIQFLLQVNSHSVTAYYTEN